MRASAHSPRTNLSRERERERETSGRRNERRRETRRRQLREKGAQRSVSDGVVGKRVREKRKRRKRKKKMIGQDLRYKKRFVPPHRPIERRYPFLEGKRTHGDHRRRGTTVFAAGPRPELPTKRIRGSILLAWTSKLERTCVHAGEMHLTCFCFFFLRHSCPRFTRPRPFFFPSLLHLSLLPPIGSTLLPPSCQLILLVLLLLSLSRTCIPLCVCELFFFFFFLPSRRHYSACARCISDLVYASLPPFFSSLQHRGP